MTRVDPRKICGSVTYTIKELAPHLDINQKTILRWIDNGLKIIPGGKKPILILGADLKQFLMVKNLRNKQCKLKDNEFNCLTCKKPRRAKRGSIKQIRNVKKAICSVCSGKMCRTFKLEQKDYPISPDPIQMSILGL